MQPRLTQVPPSAASSATATRAPRCAAMRAARTPPLPAPMMKRSKAGALIRSRRRRSLERVAQQLGDEPVDAVGAAGAPFAQHAGEVCGQLAGERHQAGGGIDATLLAPIDDLGRALPEAARRAGDLHLAADLLAEQLVEFGL